ncbi:hypothetical protein JW796_02755 [Candidatus Dojkabacteria bacterium]|nr:hypothetical protein [Candidatus Dojkabacteria bacterium]
MYKKGETIIYPLYGISKIKRIYKEKVEGVDKEYYEIAFENGLYVSVPTDQANKLGMRHPLSKKDLAKVLKDLNKKINIEDETMSNLADISKEKLATGATEDAVLLIRMLHSVAKIKQEKNHTLSLTERSNLTSAIDFIKSEIVSVFGQKGLQDFNLKNVQEQE